MNKKLEEIKLSIVSPVYRGEKMVSELVRRIVQNIETITPDYEIILVNDASPDNSWSEIVKECSKNAKVKGINLSRNFGQHYAITAGLNYAKGEWVVVMDCDLQDRPEEIPNLYNKALEGYDIVYALRKERVDSFLKKMSSTLFHKVYNALSGIKADKSYANYGIYKKNVIEEYCKMPEYARSFGSLLRYLGFKSIGLQVQQDGRLEGKSSYNLYKLLKLSFDVIVAGSNRPLKIAIIIGFIMSLISLLLAVYNVVAHWVGIISLEGYTSTLFSIWFVGGIILMVLGILGLYIGKIFDQVKRRPLYVVMDKINFN